MSFRIEAACGCNTGKVRKNNEDNFFFNGCCLNVENNGLERPLRMDRPLKQKESMAVFDGMGGENFGEYASYAAADCMKNTLRKRWSCFTSERKYLNCLCMKLNDAVVAKARELVTEQMGATLVAFCFSHNYVYTYNLGDSRAYRLRDGEITQLSEDHVVKWGERPQKKAPLTQHLGIDPEESLIEPHMVRDELKYGDQYLLCSDGLTDMMTDLEIVEIMDSTNTAEACVQRLVDTALEKGGKDNVTVIVCRIK